ncbi:MAG TPA: choice-of-anchor Q domain-containing protein [Chitinophagaceae bacterium]|nr:choice-of-anchor Q domain-containing protein [Chitinophagaceae bacterium]
MRKSLFFIPALTLFLIISCTKESFITSPDAFLSVSVDTLSFDTVFTQTGSVTQTLKIFNNNDQKLKLSSVELMGGVSSPFRINVDGTPGPAVNGIEIEPNDSAYVFVTVSINPSQANSPFIVRDSIRVNYNGNNRIVQLNAYGQNAHYVKGEIITTNTTWNNTLPYVILDGVLIDAGVTLTIQQGTRVHFHADAPMIVDGTLIVNGTKKDSVTFQGDRLDQDYRDLPAGWPGIYFRNSSNGNSLRYAIIKNAYQGLIAGKATGSFPKLALNECVIDNIYDAGLTGIGSSIKAVNCLISNCGLNVLLANGGDYELTHCTVASYSNVYVPHKKPVLVISNWDSTNQVNTYDMKAIIRNNIFWGDYGNVDDEVVILRRGSNPFNVTIENSLYKAKNNLANATLANNLVNTPPLFDSIDDNGKVYDFRINKGRSPVINKGKNLSIPFDLEGKPRDAQPDMGSYEKQ